MKRAGTQMRMLVPTSDLERILADEIMSVETSESTVALTFAAYETGNPRFFRVELGHSAADDLRGIASKVLAELERRLYDHGLRVHPYSRTARLDDHEIEYLNLREQRSLLDVVAPLDSPKQLDPLEHDDMQGPHLTFYIVSVRTPRGTWLHCSRLMSPGSQPQRTRLALIKGHGDGFFDRLSQPMYFLDLQSVDCVWHGHHLFILDKERFERTFRLDPGEDAHHAASSIVYSIAPQLPFANTDEFIAACQRDPRMATKVARMQGQPHLALLSIQRAKDAKVRFDLDIEFERGPDGQEMLRFVPRYKWQYVSILGDEYVTSPVTGLDYESNSKRLLRSRESTQAPTLTLTELGRPEPALVRSRSGAAL